MFLIPMQLNLIKNVIVATEVACLLVTIHCLFLFIVSMENWKFVIIKQLKATVKGIFTLISSCLFFHLLAVCFGAPFLTETSETFHFAMLLTCCAVLPAVVTLGNNFSLWVKVYADNSPDIGCALVAFILSVCSILGAWLGAFPIPLDWDRPWQVWPISCVFGTLAGYGVGLITSSGLLLYKIQIANKQKNKFM
ncbi:PIGF [Acanthosepion pharaonis]|uniref:PIGF n=1 Tax=Acanthosepion pharaonis TaxID=158019 RepID=A0A812AMS9_ACAPH|nr:PIGF [Sepia pharaonis]